MVVPVPNPTYYRHVGREKELFLAAYRSGKPMMLKGPTGCGKTRFVEHMASELGTRLITVSCNEDTTATDLLGRHLLADGDTRWQDGPLTRAVREGCLVYLDEIAEARADAMVAIHSLTDHRRELFLDRTGETLSAPEGFSLVMSFNPGYQKSLRELKPSTRQRFVGISFSYPDAETESEIIQAESEVDARMAKRLVKIGTQIRSLKEFSLMESASTRLLIAAGSLIHQGLEPRAAAFAAIAEPLTDDADALSALRELIHLAL